MHRVADHPATRVADHRTMLVSDLAAGLRAVRCWAMLSSGGSRAPSCRSAPGLLLFDALPLRIRHSTPDLSSGRGSDNAALLSFFTSSMEVCRDACCLDERRCGGVNETSACLLWNDRTGRSDREP